MKLLIHNNYGNISQALINWIQCQSLFDKVNDASNFNKCIQNIRDNSFDILLTDCLPLDITINKLKVYVNNFSPSLKIICYINQLDVIMAPHLHKIGIDGIMTFKTIYELLESVQYIKSGEKYISPHILQNIHLFNQFSSIRENLTNQEYEIFIRNKMRVNDNDIAKALWCSIKHVRNTKSIAMNKVKRLNSNHSTKSFVQL